MDIDSISRLGTHSITKDDYEDLKRKTNVFPYIGGKHWVGQLSKTDDDYSLIVFSTGIRVAERLVDADTKVVKLKIKYYDGRAEVTRDFNCDILTKLGTKELYNFGVRFSEDNANKVVKYLMKSEGVAPIIRSYSKLGWSKEDDVDIFRGHSAFCSQGVYNGLIYNGKLGLSPVGSLESWLEMIETEVLKCTAMTFVMLLGFAGALVARLNEKKDIGSLMFNLSNKSSKGKTTTAMLATSVFSNPMLNRGCAISFNSTENALIQFISSCGGHTVVIDEVAMNNSKDFNRIMYSICNGRSKMRLNGNATQKEVTEFNGVVISTAEFSLITEDTPNGVKTRVFEIKDPLTDSAENSDNIKSRIYQNYALAGEHFVKFLLQKADAVFQDYENDKKFLCDKCSDKKELSERILSKLATVLTTARYVNDIFQMGINEADIADYILKLERQISIEAKPEDRLLEIVRQEVSRNSSRYMIDTNVVPSSCCGAIKTKHKCSEIQISQTVFEDMMEDYGVNDWKGVLKILRDQDILQTEPDRLYKRVTLVKEVGRQKCYCFKLKNEVSSRSSVESKRNITEELCDIDIFKEMTSAIVEN